MNNLAKFIEDLVNNAQNKLPRDIVTELLELSLNITKKEDIWSRSVVLQGFILVYFGRFFAKYVNNGNANIFIRDFKKIANFFLRNPSDIIADIIKLPSKICANLLLFLRIPLTVISSLAVNNANFLSRKSIISFVGCLFDNNKSQISENFANLMTGFLVKISPALPFLTVILVDKILAIIINYLDSSKLSRNPDSLLTYNKLKEQYGDLVPPTKPDPYIPPCTALTGKEMVEEQVESIKQL